MKGHIETKGISFYLLNSHLVCLPKINGINEKVVKKDVCFESKEFKLLLLLFSVKILHKQIL